MILSRGRKRGGCANLTPQAKTGESITDKGKKASTGTSRKKMNLSKTNQEGREGVEVARDWKKGGGIW